MPQLDLDRPAQVQRIASHIETDEETGMQFEIADQYYLNWQIMGNSYSRRIDFQLAQILVSSGLTYGN